MKKVIRLTESDLMRIVKRVMTENQYNLIKEMEDDLISYESDFESGINILVIFESNPNYESLVDFFE